MITFIMSTHYWIDSHAHLDLMEQYNISDWSGVGGILTISTCKTHAESLKKFVRTVPSSGDGPWVYKTAGIHPGTVQHSDLADWSWLHTACADPTVVAVGEIGLDKTVALDIQTQVQAFEPQIRVAIEFDLPIVVHTRYAEAEVLDVIARNPNARGVLHSFNGSLKGAQTAIALGWYVSFSGMLTFKKSGYLRDIARQLPGDRILVETDAPYLAPEPVRGHRNNKPGNVAHTGAVLAEVREVPVERVMQQTCENTLRLFSRVKT